MCEELLELLTLSSQLPSSDHLGLRVDLHGCVPYSQILQNKQIRMHETVELHHRWPRFSLLLFLQTILTVFVDSCKSRVLDILLMGSMSPRMHFC